MLQEHKDEERILILAPRGRDAQVIEQVLTRVGVHCIVCVDYKALLQQIDMPAAAALIAEEALHGVDIEPLVEKLAQQPSWSDFPFVLLMPPLSGKADAGGNAVIPKLGNVILLERPVNAETLRTAAASVLRARRQQYQARSDLHERMRLNATLESRIAERTAELAQANDRLMQEMAERERAQIALVQTQKMEALGHLTSGISHDFNNVLSIIQGNADLIKLLASDDRIKRMANTIRKAAEQGAKLTGQLLAFSRAQPLDLKTFDLNKALESVQDLLASSLGSNIQVRLEMTADLPPVKADSQQIELAVLNLLINAKDAMRDSGTVTISTAKKPAPVDLTPGHDYAVISVTDNGEGINPEIIARVFDPFFTTKPHGKGTGLGLSQVYGIAQQSGGTAKIRSEVGVGTTVEIWLPFANPDDMVEPVPRADVKTGIDGPRRCILVVEDDPHIRQFMVESLEILGYQVAHAEDAQTALDRIKSMEPDLLITDFLMPSMTGAELVQHARRKYPELPVIIATGYADLRAINEVTDSDMVLRKPFQLQDLAHKVQQALARTGISTDLSSFD
jgi:signal transduction histidine kinase/CheY-like chemotaxis protein